MPTTRRATPFPWFREDAEAALRLQSSVFPDACVRNDLLWGAGAPAPEGTVMSASIEMAGQGLMVLNGGPAPAFNASFSIFVCVETQEEIDELWDRLTAEDYLLTKAARLAR